MSTPLTNLAPGAKTASTSPGRGISTSGQYSYSKSVDGKTAMAEGSWQKTADCPEGKMVYDKHHHHHQEQYGGGYNWAWLIIVFIVIVVIVWLLLYVFRPEFVQKKDGHDQCSGEIDNGRAIIWAIIIAIIIIIIIAIIRAAACW